MSLEFRVDPATKSLVKVTEATTTPDELRSELQAEADAAQNRLNAANANKEQTAANLVSATEADEAADAELEAANEEVSFSTARLSELDSAVSLLAELAGATPEGENAGSAEPGQEVNVPTHTAEVAPA